MPNTPPAHRAELARIAAAVTIHSADAFTFAGRRFEVAPTGSDDVPYDAGHRLITHLRDCLYAQAYCHPFDGVWHARRVERAVVDPGFTQTLSAANASQARLDEGWIIHAMLPNGQFAVRKGNVMRTVGSGAFVLEDGMLGRLQPNAPVRLWWPRDSMTVQPGFYIAFGEFIPDVLDEQSLLRVYFNMRPTGLASLINGLTTTLNAHAIPFQLKCPASPRNAARRDTAVLYIAQRHYRLVAMLVGPLLPDMRPYLRRGAPLFTCIVSRGVSVAQDPGTGESFGQHRMRLVAAGLWQAFRTGRRTTQGKLIEIESVFVAHHINLNQPHLNNSDLEDEVVINFTDSNKSTQSIASSSSTVFLDTAAHIGAEICRDAVWWGNQCNWMGDSFEMVKRRPQIVYRACGPDLYAGTSGIALFLAQLHSLTGESTFRQTAEAALQHALMQVDEIKPNLRAGLYAGWAGGIYAAHRIGVLLGSEAIHEHTRRLLQRFMALDVQNDEHELDVIGGWAGAIPVLLMMHTIWPELGSLALAEQLGDGLLAATRCHGETCSWHTLRDAAHRDLCGFAHGAAGIAWALLELHHATGNPRFRQMADAGMAYERRHFNPRQSNWPDFRQPPTTYPIAWCHGASGIGLARLRAYQLTRDQACLNELSAAIEITRQDLAKASTPEVRNYSLCHGLGGNADLLLCASVMPSSAAPPSAVPLSVSSSQLRHEAKSIGTLGIERYAKRRLPWPCGVDEVGKGHAPGLMVGTAGIGYFYLRLHAPTTVPSVLAPTLDVRTFQNL